MQPFITSRRVQVALGILALLILMCVSFLAGAKASEHRDRHLCNWSNHYPDMMEPHRGSRMPLPHGAFGRVLSATGTNLIIEGQDHFEQNILMTSSTAIRTERGTASAADIRPDMLVGVFGTPNERGQIEARLIRVLPTKR